MMCQGCTCLLPLFILLGNHSVSARQSKTKGIQQRWSCHKRKAKKKNQGKNQFLSSEIKEGYNKSSFLTLTIKMWCRLKGRVRQKNVSKLNTEGERDFIRLLSLLLLLSEQSEDRDFVTFTAPWLNLQLFFRELASGSAKVYPIPLVVVQVITDLNLLRICTLIFPFHGFHHFQN